MSEAYEVRLADFSGSLDLLLHLVRSAKMNIEDIRLSEITDQYLEYMDQADGLDMERASDFLETASVLILIKSRCLLPQLPEAAEEEADPEQELLERMRLYAVFQAAAEPLRQREQSGADYFYKLPEDVYSEEAEARLVNADAGSLRSMVRLLAKRSRRGPEARPVHRVEPEAYSVRTQKELLLLRLRRGPFLFAELFSTASPRLEIVVTFAALLELWGAGAVRLTQSRPFAALEVEREESA